MTRTAEARRTLLGHPLAGVPIRLFDARSVSEWRLSSLIRQLQSTAGGSCGIHSNLDAKDPEVFDVVLSTEPVAGEWNRLIAAITCTITYIATMATPRRPSMAGDEEIEPLPRPVAHRIAAGFRGVARSEIVLDD